MFTPSSLTYTKYSSRKLIRLHKMMQLTESALLQNHDSTWQVLQSHNGGLKIYLSRERLPAWSHHSSKGSQAIIASF